MKVHARLCEYELWHGHDVLVFFFVLQNQGRAIMAGDAAEGPKDFAGSKRQK